MADREKVIKGLEICYRPPAKCEDCPYHDLPDEQSCNDMLCLDALALLKKQEEQKQKWLQTIADNQLAVGGADPLTEYEQGKWDGLQIAFEIMTEQRRNGANSQKERTMEKFTALDVPGLWCDDITFCSERCGWKSCPRNKENIRDRTIPHSFSVGRPVDCPKEANK